MPTFSEALVMPGSIEDAFQKMPISGGGFGYGYSILHESSRLQAWYKLLYSTAGTNNTFYLNWNNGRHGN